MNIIFFLMLPGWRNSVPRETGNLVPFGSLGSKQLFAKLARKAGIELKVQSHRARFARNSCWKSQPWRMPGWCSPANHPALSRPGPGFEQLLAKLARKAGHWIKNPSPPRSLRSQVLRKSRTGHLIIWLRLGVSGRKNQGL